MMIQDWSKYIENHIPRCIRKTNIAATVINSLKPLPPPPPAGVHRVHRCHLPPIQWGFRIIPSPGLQIEAMNIDQYCGKTYSIKNHFKTHVFIHGAYLNFVSDSAILVGKHILTKITSKSTFLFLEHSRSWSVILQFLWENILKKESRQNPHF